jgi:O-antigen ligase
MAIPVAAKRGQTGMTGEEERRIAASNRFALPLTVLGAPLIGSGLSVLVALGMLAGAWAMLRDATLRGFAPAARACGLAFAAFFAAEFVSALVNWNGQASLIEIGENLVFLGFLPLFALMRAPAGEVSALIHRFAPWAAIAAFAGAWAEIVFLHSRAQLGAGNAGIFAVTCCLLYAANVLSAMSGDGRERLLALGGSAAAAGAILLSGSRGMWPLIVAIPVLYAAFAGREALPRLTLRNAAIALVLLLVAAFAVQDVVSRRVNQALGDFDKARQGELDTSLGKRLAVWGVGIEAVKERPMLGHGPDAPPRLILERVNSPSGRPLGYTHFHNLFLNEAVRAGALGVLAMLAMFVVPLWQAFRNGGPSRPGDPVFHGRMLLVGLQLSWLTSGMINIGFDHDIMDAVFVAVTAISIYLVTGAERKTGEAAGK